MAIRDLNGQIEALRQDFIAAFEAILTEEQLEILQRLQESRRLFYFSRDSRAFQRPRRSR